MPLRPEIESYLREHGARYTTEALRMQLITAGHDPAEIDAALRETDEARALRLAETRALRSRFWCFAMGLHLAALAVAVIWVLQGSNAIYAFAVVLVLGLTLLIGLGISGLIGRSLLGRSGLAVALVVPLISALLLGGWCMAIMGGPALI